MGVLSILFRQTNVIWIIWIVFVKVLDDYHRAQKKKEERKEQILFEETMGFITYLFSNLSSLLSKFFPFILLVLIFGMFVVINKGIVVGKGDFFVQFYQFEKKKKGDRSAHEVVFNFGQFCYF
jgi:hypothetical protein